MDLADLDRALGHLRDTTDRAGANLLELDQSPARALLAAARLQDLSARRWIEAEAALAGLFPSYAALSAVVEAAVAARGSGSMVSPARRAQLEQLVLGPSVELPERAVPMAERDLVSVSRTIHRCTPEEMLTSMAEPFALARSVIVAAAEAWDVGGPLVQRLRDRLADAAEDGGPLGGGDQRASLARRVDLLEQELLSDPLAFDRAAAGALEGEIDGLVAAVADVHRLRAEFDLEMAAAQARLAALAGSVTETEGAHGQVAARIAGLAPQPAVPLDALGDELDRAETLASRGDWVSVQAGLAGWRAQVERHEHDVDRHRAELDEVMQERRQLRGRLEAYTAKAAALGCVEDDVLEQLRHDAERCLYDAPADLRLAGEGVRRYQRALEVLVLQRSARAT